MLPDADRKYLIGLTATVREYGEGKVMHDFFEEMENRIMSATSRNIGIKRKPSSRKGHQWKSRSM